MPSSLPRGVRAALLLLCAAASAACSPPLQNGGVHVRPGAEARLDVLCRWHHGPGQADLCNPPEDDVDPAKPDAPATAPTAEPAAAPTSAPSR
jgi:hypothetical protein